MSCRPNIRDRALPSIDRGRQLIADYGLRRFAVTLRRRIWDSQYPGAPGATFTTEDIVLFPLPKVRDAFGSASGAPSAQLQYILQHGQVIKDRWYEITKITPAYTSTCPTPGTGGYTIQQLRMEPPPDAKNVEPVVILVGDDGYARECIQESLEQDLPFEYRMLVRETDRPRVPITSLAITRTLNQLKAVGTFADGQETDLTGLVLWFSDNVATATVNQIGVITPGSVGTAHLHATFGTQLESNAITYTI